MTPPARGSVALAVALVAVGVAAVAAATRDASTSAPRPVSATPSPTVADPIRVAYTERFEPFDYLDAPPLARTPIDGYYVRVVTLEELGGPKVGVPTHCRRCVPFEIDPGLETLTLYRGRYFVEHQLTGRRGLGHFTVDGRAVRFFNDPNCSRTVGDYRWRAGGGRLTFEVIGDPCPFGTTPNDVDHRARDLTYSAWIRIQPCTAQIRWWWPALFDCAAAGSRSS